MRFGILSIAVGLGAVLSGCGDPAAEGRVDVYPVTGTIMYGGGPVADALVSFAPEQEGQPVATGRTNAQGEFTLTTYEAGDGAAAGNYTVVVTKVAAGSSAEEAPEHDPEAVDPWAADPAGSHDAEGDPDDGGGSLLPEPSTPLKATVTADGRNHFDLVIE